MNGIDLLPSELKKIAIEKSGGIIETDECCELHPKYTKNLMPDGEIICPKCWVEKRDKQLAVVWTEEQYEFTDQGRKKYLYRHSIVHNKKILEKGFKDFYAKTAVEKRVKQEMISVSKEIVAGQTFNVFVQGGAGRGKSHLAMAALKNANELLKNKRCLFANFSKVLELIRAAINNPQERKDEAYYIKLLSECDVLVIDDIGAELSLKTVKHASDFTSRVLYAILDAREDKCTIFTSNFSTDKLEEVLDERLVSRINSNIRLVSFDGVVDKRSKKNELKTEQSNLFEK